MDEIKGILESLKGLVSQLEAAVGSDEAPAEEPVEDEAAEPAAEAPSADFSAKRPMMIALAKKSFKK
jgi:hypothetical protein